MHGKNGSPGNSGYNGGQFYAKERKFINLSFLTIEISGGDGGKGQDGGNGADGLDGSDRGKNFVTERNKSFLVSRKKVSGNLKKTVEKCLRYIFTFNEKYEEIYEAYDPGQEGGNGGRGGVGGDVGCYDSVQIEIGDKEEPSTIEEKPTIIKENNKKGIDGKRGSPGHRGKNGPKGYEEFNTKFTEETAYFKKLDTKFVDGFRVATYITTSMLTAAVIAENSMTFAIKGVFSGFRGYEESNTKFTEGTADSKDLDTIFGDGIRVLSNTTISAATAVGCMMAKTMTIAKSAMTHVIKEVDKKNKPQ
ncbi:20234_t:CDS:2 [Gigaspora margarita]|uniref:20234_t:CDS:1 n=1 Tax=Gigaspora margarita TaxID=4874 RepID=A0ABN7WQR5_GIGMA|nr:20234_t:CDS:2 [Gigaspora margarita]